MFPRSHVAAIALLALALPLALLMSAACAAAPPDTLRVALLRYHSAVKQITVTASGDFAAWDTLTGAVVASSSPDAPVSLEAGRSSITLTRGNGDSAAVGASVTVTCKELGGNVTIQSPGRQTRSYRGSVEVTCAGGYLQLVNVVDLEDYLLGVVPSEMPNSYPAEALKAQAVAARTYALANLGKHAATCCNLCDCTHCQVYDGAGAEKPPCTQAVNETRGVVLTYDGAPASVMYSADCGGATRNYGRSAPYLRGVQEPEEVPHGTWRLTIKLSDLARRLVKAGVKEAKGLTAVKVSEADGSGRVTRVDIVTDAGTAQIPGEKLVAIVGSEAKSLMFTLDLSPDGASIVLNGRGCGHGVGMCQVGAKGLAQAPFGYTYDRILAHYFPGTALSGQMPKPANLARLSPPATLTADASPDERRAPAVQAVPSNEAAAGPQQPAYKPALEVRVKEPRL